MKSGNGATIMRNMREGNDTSGGGSAGIVEGRTVGPGSEALQ